MRRTILAYLGILTVLMGFGAPAGGLVYIPVSFILKNRLHFSAHEIADFRLLTGLPLYFAAAFGWARDWSARTGRGDRHLLLVFGAVGATTYLVLALLPLGYPTVVISFIVLTATWLVMSSAMRGLASALGQQRAITGQVSAVWTVVSMLPSVAGTLLGGAVSQRLEAESAGLASWVVFIIGAATMAAVVAFAAWKPAAVFAATERGPGPASRWAELRRLAAYRPVYPALAVALLWYFMPGSGTPLQFHFQNTLRGTDAQWGQWNAIADVANVPGLLAFGVLCRRVPLRALLLWGTVAGVGQMVPLLFIDSISGAFWAAVPFGLLSAVATVAYLDLTIRTCPPGLEGTMLMSFYCLESLASRLGDVVGTRLYDHGGGFTTCVLSTAASTLVILPILLLVPRSLVDRPDGHRAAG